MAVSRWTREAVARDIESGRLSLRILAETIERMDRITHRLLMPTLGTLDAEFRAREDAEIAAAETDATNAAHNAAMLREVAQTVGWDISQIDTLSTAMQRQAREEERYA